jgi:hypothetical protein
MSGTVQDSLKAYVAFGKPNAGCGATTARSRRCPTKYASDHRIERKCLDHVASAIIQADHGIV